MRFFRLAAGSIAFAIVLFTLTASAQVRSYKWTDELCSYRATYDAKKVSISQLRSAEKLLGRSHFGLETRATVFKISDIPTLDAAALEKEYSTKTAELKALDLPKLPYWQQLRERTLVEMKMVYELSRVTIAAHQTPEKLNDLTWGGACKTKYARPLIAGGDQLLAAWRTVNEDSRKKNADPERLRRKFESELALPDRMKFALVEVMTFGWWNCANEQIKYVLTEGEQERQFKKLFIRVKETCDEP